MGADGLPATYKPLDATGSTRNVVTTTSFKVRFDRFLLPATTYRQSICVQSRLQVVKTLQDCTQPVFLETTYDPVHREIIYRQSADMTRPHLAPNTTYQVTLFPAGSRDIPGGVSAFDGAPLDSVTTFTFSTGEAPRLAPGSTSSRREISSVLRCSRRSSAALTAPATTTTPWAGARRRGST